MSKKKALLINESGEYWSGGFTAKYFTKEIKKGKILFAEERQIREISLNIHLGIKWIK